jgi:hypothetical protein
MNWNECCVDVFGTVNSKGKLADGRKRPSFCMGKAEMEKGKREGRGLRGK